MYDEEDLLPISALQHLLFCERRAALVHIEGLWDENRFTAEGRVLHDRAHEPGPESRGDVRIVRGLRLRSLELGLVGQADVVEFRRLSPDDSGGIALRDVDGHWRPFPVEYKRGRMRHERAYEVQLCAQALCLEEMLNTTIQQGALFYGKSQHRVDVNLDTALRDETRTAAARLHLLVESRKTPSAVPDARCGRCSLHDLCLPEKQMQRSVKGYLATAFATDEATS